MKPSALREVAGLPQNLAETPACRVPGPLWKIHGFDGNIIPTSSNLHPYGPQKRKYLPAALFGDSADGQMQD